jgi:hypothetical protein
MADKYLIGNVFDQDSPQSVFDGWLAGPFLRWAAREKGDRASEKRAKAEVFSKLATDGARENVEFKFSRVSEGTTSEKGRNDSSGVNTLVVFISGQMTTELVARKTGDRFLLQMNREGDYLAWSSSVYNHSWKAEKQSLCVTLRWSEDAVPTSGP